MTADSFQNVPEFANTTQEPLPPEKGAWRGLISVLLLFHLVVITCWALPVETFPVPQVKRLVRPYMLWTGLFQSWDFFSPHPKAENSYVEAIVITQSHRQLVWAFPRMEQLGYGQRYVEERYRKFTEVLPDSKYALLWPDVAMHIARQVDDPADPPAIVLLVNVSSPIEAGIDPRRVPPPKPNIFYEYIVSLPSGVEP